MAAQPGGSKNKPQKRRRKINNNDTKPKRKRKGRSRVPEHLKKGAEVQALYDDKWWDTKILLWHTARTGGGFHVKYYDDEGCTQEHVPACNIRPRPVVVGDWHCPDYD